MDNPVQRLNGSVSPLDQSPTLLPEWIEVAAIEPNPFQYRKFFPEEELRELADSIRAHGLLQAIVVRPIGEDRYELVAGERRLRAVKMLGWSHIPATVRTLSDIDAAILTGVENEQREDVDDWSRAVYVRNLFQLAEKQGEPLSQRELARRMGKAVSFITNRVKLYTKETTDPDLVQLAQEHSNVMSSVLLIAEVGREAINPETGEYLREELKERVRRGDGFRKIEKYKADVEARIRHRRDSERPDAFTRKTLKSQQERSQEARKGADEALSAIEGHLVTLESWWPHLNQADREKLTERLRRRLNGLVEE